MLEEWFACGFLCALIGLHFLARECRRLRVHVASQRERVSSLQCELEYERGAANAKRVAVQEAESRLRDTFAQVSQEALRANMETFVHLASDALTRSQGAAQQDLAAREESIAQLLRPLADGLERMDHSTQALEEARARAYGQLGEQLRGLGAAQAQLHQETQRLQQALHTPTQRGRWGELQLRRVVELAGMVAHCDFSEQRSGTGRGKPDLVIHLPGNRQVIIDAKAPLPDQDDYGAAVRRHIQSLGAKDYWREFKDSCEFVVMFIPGEGLLSQALHGDPELIEYGAGHRIMLATPTTLIALLRAIAHGWQQQDMAANARAISAAGRELHDRLRVLVGHFGQLRRSLDGTVQAYNQAVGSFESRVVPGARRLEELGAGSEPIDAPPTITTNPRRAEGDDGRRLAAV
jgi:DNA recombination protein RmuC